MPKYGDLFCRELDYFQCGVPKTVDLLNLRVDDDDGSIEAAYRFALKELNGLDNEDVFALLGFADMVVKDLFIEKETFVAGEDGQRVTIDLLECIRPTEVLPTLMLVLENVSVSLGDVSGGAMPVTGIRLSCAYILAQVWYIEVMPKGEAWSYAIEAGKAHAMCRMLTEADSPIAKVFAKRLSKTNAAAGARIRWDRDPKSAVMAEIEAEWRSRKGAGKKFTAVGFARDMHKVRRFRAVTLEAIKNAQTRWSKNYHPAS